MTRGDASKPRTMETVAEREEEEEERGGGEDGETPAALWVGGG